MRYSIYYRSLLDRARRYAKGSPAARTAIFAAQNAFWGTVSTFSRGPLIGGTKDRYFLCAVVRVKDEARFLPEWLAYHKTIGVEHFYVYDNGSTDRLREAIGPFLEAGDVTVIAWPRRPASPSCYIHYLAHYGESTRWAAFFDVDEFLIEKDKGALRSTLRAANSVPAIAVNWRYFGGSGHDNVPPGLVLRAFSHMALRPDDHVKVVCQPSMVYKFRNSHNFYYKRGLLARSDGGRRVFGSFSKPIDSPMLSLHHYVYRSRDDYLRKSSAGFVDSRGGIDLGRSSDRADVEFKKHNDIQWRLPAEIEDEVIQALRSHGYPQSLYEPK